MGSMGLVVVVIVGLALGGVIWIYNRLIRDRNQVSNAWSDIDVQLKRRHDLVPRLVTLVQTYADYEKATLTAVTTLRTQSEQASNLPDKAAAEDALQISVNKLLVVAEDYPELQADDNFRQLHDALTEVEDHLQYARRFYNGAVRLLNTHIQSFPHVLVARAFGFSEAQFFEAEAHARINPEVQL